MNLPAATSFISWLSAIPLLLILLSVIVAWLTWQSGGRTARIVMGWSLSLFGLALILSSVGNLFSLLAGVLIGVLGLGVLFSVYRQSKS